ncbi:hypothetical protein NC652_010595 [Populus alba x Populus x berolinensis]|nr:hypothetical protein NC652_010595 [Populus alba x Populus x berolinensis]
MILQEFNLFLLAFIVILACICRIKKHLGHSWLRRNKFFCFILASSRESGAGGTSMSRPLNSLGLLKWLMRETFKH